jgi:hypothetical protein
MSYDNTVNEHVAKRASFCQRAGTSNLDYFKWHSILYMSCVALLNETGENS